MLERELATYICLHFTPISGICISLTQDGKSSAKLQSEKMTQNSWKIRLTEKY